MRGGEWWRHRKYNRRYVALDGGDGHSGAARAG
jgi:hypothetical protein